MIFEEKKTSYLWKLQYGEASRKEHKEMYLVENREGMGLRGLIGIR